MSSADLMSVYEKMIVRRRRRNICNIIAFEHDQKDFTHHSNFSTGSHRMRFDTTTTGDHVETIPLAISKLVASSTSNLCFA